MKTLRVAASLFSLILFASCADSLLREDNFTDLGPTNFFRSEADANALVTAVYAVGHGLGSGDNSWGGRDAFLFGEVNTDIMYNTDGGLEGQTRPLQDFTVDGTHPLLRNRWNFLYLAVARANLALEAIPEIQFDADRKQRLLAEVRFLRAEAYMILFEYFGPVPLLVSSSVDPQAHPSRATEEEMIRFVEDEFRAAAQVLPLTQTDYPRATRGAALGFLTRFHLNNKKWQQAADVAQEVMGLGIYSLFRGPDGRTDLFKVEYERNSEFIYARPFISNSIISNTYLSVAAPPGYAWNNPPKTKFATNFKLWDSFSGSFHPEDERGKVILTQFRHVNGNTVQLGPNNARSFKFQEDPGSTAARHGNDVPAVRYADILLMRAEALNELAGPNAESIALINQVREVARAPEIALADFSSREALRDHILQERAWEFHTEGIRRLDLIRHGKLIEFAQQRGKAAQPFHARYPIPQNEVDMNPNLVQNPGY
jgi:starch-binding outer membrane protein, SusD/RagB family